MPTTYGDHPSQIVHRHVPRTAPGPAPVAVLLHGGWWRDRHDAGLMAPLADDLRDAGWAVWNVEYRRTGADGGGWPQTVDDVARALDLLADTADHDDALDVSRVVAIGHSAGAHLALMTATESLVTSVVALAPITDLRRCAEEELGEGPSRPFSDPTPHQGCTRPPRPCTGFLSVCPNWCCTATPTSAFRSNTVVTTSRRHGRWTTPSSTTRSPGPITSPSSTPDIGPGAPCAVP